MKRSLILSSILYLLIPFLIFCFGYLHWYWTIIIVFLAGVSIKNVFSERAQSQSREMVSLGGYGIIICFSLFYSFILGVGGFWTQSYDWAAKNPILNDLSLSSWPLIMDTSSFDVEIQQITGAKPVAFVYYFFFYLPAALVGHLLGVGAARFTLFLWTALGIFFVLSLLISMVGFAKRRLIFICIGLITFGGLDFIGHCIRLLYNWNPSIPLSEQTLYATWCFDEWCRPFLTYYPSHWTSLFWCFNQCIPIWIVVILIIFTSNVRIVGFIFSFSLLYSPWCTLGLFPIVGYYVLHALVKKECTLASIINVQNVIFPLLLLLVVGTFYMSNRTPLEECGFWFKFLTAAEFYPQYITFIIVEIGTFIFILRNQIKQNPFIQGAIVMSLIIPFYKMTIFNDWVMRASIPCLFVFFIYMLQWSINNWAKYRKLIILVWTIGSFTSIQGIFKSIDETVCNGGPITHFEESSFGNPDSRFLAYLGRSQFYAYDYEDTFFWKYLAK